jgi:hypothetical protein
MTAIEDKKKSEENALRQNTEDILWRCRVFLAFFCPPAISPLTVSSVFTLAVCLKALPTFFTLRPLTVFYPPTTPLTSSLSSLRKS